jgi:hypothetical protein
MLPSRGRGEANTEEKRRDETRIFIATISCVGETTRKSTREGPAGGEYEKERKGLYRSQPPGEKGKYERRTEIEKIKHATDV